MVRRHLIYTICFFSVNIGNNFIILVISDKDNKKAFDVIHRGIFVLCLDRLFPLDNPDTRLTVTANQMLHGGGSDLNTCNRWFDKTLQVSIV